MKKIAVGVGALMVVAVIAGLMSERAALKSRLEPLEQQQRALDQKERATLHVNEQVDLPAGRQWTYPVTPAIVPGTLSGSWKASGERSGGMDNAISGFKLLGPRDEVLSASEGGSSGKFYVKISTPGTYSFIFNNGGLFKTTSRRVFLDAEYKPD